MIGIGRIGALALLGSLSLTARASAQLVDFGDTINAPGVYVLNGNQSGSGDGIKIESDDVTLFLLRFTLRGDGNTGNGIQVVGYDRVTIWGGRVAYFGNGIVMEDGEHNAVRDTRIDDCHETGMYLSSVSYSEFVRLRVDHNGYDGISAFNCSDNRFFSVRSDNNGGDGIDLEVQIHTSVGEGGHGLASSNRFKKCWLAYNHEDGLRLRDADNNEVLENQCVANELVGIHLTTAQDDDNNLLGAIEGSRDNQIEGNWCPANGAGIVVEWGCHDNHIVENIALASFEVDVYDGNAPPPCENTWLLNLFILRGGAGASCIF